MKLTRHFTLEEMTLSQTAARLGIDNTPSQKDIHNLERVCHTLEIIRNVMQAPIYISSGYRSVELNAQIPGSSPRSKHTKGLAADFVVAGYTVNDAFDKVRKCVGFDTLINEYGRWLHLDIDDDLRHRVLITSRSDDGKVKTREVK